MTQFQSTACVMDNLIGKTVRKIYVNDDQSRLFVFHDTGFAAYRTDADCCSETWIADLVGVSALLGHTVMEAEEVELPQQDDNRTRQDIDLFYGIKLMTTGGYVDIIYRNSSNGYYGGSLLRDEKAGVPDVAELIEICEDYSA